MLVSHTNLTKVCANPLATYKRIRNVDLKIPSSVSPEAADLITRVSIFPFLGTVADDVVITP